MKGEIIMGRKKKYVCVECGGVMEPADEHVLVCVSCKHSCGFEDYGHENDYDEYYNSAYGEDEIPEECEACGGPYPNCMTSCTLFD